MGGVSSPGLLAESAGINAETGARIGGSTAYDSIVIAAAIGTCCSKVPCLLHF